MSGTITSTIGQISAGDRTITLKLPDGRVHYWDAGILLGLSPLNDQTKKKIAAIVEVIEQAVPQNTRYLAKRSQKRLTLIRKAATRYLRYSRTERAAPAFSKKRSAFWPPFPIRISNSVPFDLD